MIINEAYNTLVSAPVRNIKAKVELSNGSTFAATDKLVSFKIERVCEDGKFFGFGICQHAEVEILDTNREVDYITTEHSFTTCYEDDIYTNPVFYITQTRRDENTNGLKFYGYDLLHAASTQYTADLGLVAPYTLADAAQVCATFLGASGMVIERVGAEETAFTTVYETGANIEGTETIREFLDDIAEATQTIYFVNSANQLVFKRLNSAITADLSITKEDYITLECGDGRRLAAVCHATELGNNITAALNITGSTQYVRDNAFWTYREDIDTVVEAALAAVGGMTIQQFNATWRGNPLLELGDKIALTTKDDNTVISYVLNDVITYTGALEQNTQWSYTDEEASASNASTLGEVLKQTYAKVDKANKNVEIVASEVGSFDGRISKLELDTDSISASVSQVEEIATQRINDTNTDIAMLTERVNATITADEVALVVEQELADGVNSITTSTGYTFNEEGLRVSKSNSDMETEITEDGMTVYKSGSTVLTANNEGVKAIDLHAETFLIIGNNSRFEDYGSSRTGCFWIGG